MIFVRGCQRTEVGRSELIIANCYVGVQKLPRNSVPAVYVSARRVKKGMERAIWRFRGNHHEIRTKCYMAPQHTRGGVRREMDASSLCHGQGEFE